MIEKAPQKVIGKELYIPHKAVEKDTVETTKLPIVYDTSASESRISPSFNDCLNPGPFLQNILWSILVRS